MNPPATIRTVVTPDAGAYAAPISRDPAMPAIAAPPALTAIPMSIVARKLARTTGSGVPGRWRARHPWEAGP